MLVPAQVSDPHINVDCGGRNVRRAAFHLLDGTRLTSHVRIIL
jgi:hypothetical protein